MQILCIYNPVRISLTDHPATTSPLCRASNPAAAAAQLSREDSQYRVGIITVGGGYEIGNVGGLFNLIDSTKTSLTASSTIPPSVIAGGGAAVAAYINANLIAPVNSLTSSLQQNANASVYFGGHVPLTPFAVSKKGWGGSFVLDANASVIANLSFIADPFANLTTAQGNAIIAGGGTYTPATNESSVLVKAAVVEELGFGYSRPMLSRETGDLTAGVRAKYYLVKLARNAQHQTSTTAGGSQSTLNASQNYTSSSGVGLDVGTLWTAKRYRVGAWVNNVNKPSFNYNTVDTTGYANPTVIAQLNTNGTYDMKPQLQRKGHFIRKARTGSSMQDWMPMQCKMLWAETSSGQR